MKMDHIERNYKIVEKRLIEQMETSLNYARDLIDSELDAGVLNIIIKPIVKSFYDHWTKGAKKGTKAQIRLALDSAKELVKNGSVSREKFDQIIEKNFPTYLDNDQTNIQTKRSHKNYKLLKDGTKKSFISQVEECILFLKVKEEIKDYKELSRLAFGEKEIAYQALKRQLDFNDEGIKIVEMDNTILKVPVGKNIIVKVLRSGFELTKKNLIENLDTIFN